jgi:hypothetical protein
VIAVAAAAKDVQRQIDLGRRQFGDRRRVLFGAIQ